MQRITKSVSFVKIVISCSNDSSIRIWDLKKLSNQEEESVPGMIRSIEVFNYHKDYVQVNLFSTRQWIMWNTPQLSSLKALRVVF